jgi:hypothetical protein
MLEKNTAGKNIDAYCTKCKLNLDHTITAMDGEVIARVRCKTCGSWHKYRSPSEPPTVRKPRVKAGAMEEAAAATVWEAGLAEAKGKERIYEMSAKYRVGDVVSHHIFGKGVVVKLYVNKCDILFKDRERLMATANE